ncbi:flavin reductase family protein [Erythrobacter sp. W302b]|uniref:flavin reductase family protein n=1 Tax=Erythrobacter sp. W302b TaxID=3389874 RepID=UPI00396AF3E9
MPASAPDRSADTRAFRQVMGQFATGVAVISLVPPGGGVSAMTINSLVSISLDPMLVSWSLQNSASLYEAYAGAEAFAFSILAESQQALARRYAARGDSALDPADFAPGPSGLPVIRGALAHIACRRFALHPAGDHTLILGAVSGIAEADTASGRPLLFFGGRFGEMAP